MHRFLVIATAGLLWIALAQAVDLPLVKEGLWSIHTQTIDNPGNVRHENSETICRNHAYDASVRARAKNHAGCKVLSESLNGGKYAMAMECVIAGRSIKSTATTTSLGENAFHSENHAAYAPALAGVTETTMIMDQKFLGACPAGAQPGDVTRADGTVIHAPKR